MGNEKREFQWGIADHIIHEPLPPRVRVDKIERQSSCEPSGSLTEFSVYRLIMEFVWGNVESPQNTWFRPLSMLHHDVTFPSAADHTGTDDSLACIPTPA